MASDDIEAGERATNDDSSAAPASPAQAQEDLTLEQLASVRVLLNPDAAATLHDILITASLEALREGPLSEAELVEHARRMWPGTGIDALRISAAMRVAQNAHYVAPVREDGQVKWALSRLGTSEVQSSRDWASEIVEATARQVLDQLNRAGRTVSIEEARLWTTILRHSLMAGIAGAFAPYSGEVDAAGEVMTVRRWDEAAIRDVVARAIGDPADAELLLGLAIDAFDPVTPFGSELVTTITVGYMLHAIVGRRDRAAARAVVGSLNEDRAVLDTPILLRLLGASEIARPIERVIEAAIAAGMKVIAPEHYIEELRELLANTENDELQFVQSELQGGLEADLLGSLVDDQVLGLWLRAVQSGRYMDWPGFRAAAAQLPQTLESLGVTVRPHYNTEADKVDTFERALADEIRSASARPRRPAALERDAHAMAMAHRRRTKGERAFWPAAWIITTDTRMAPAYRSLWPRDPFPLTLTPAAWISVVSNCSPPAEVGRLAEAASQLFGEEGFMTVAARFPVRTAVEIARALGPASGGSPLDVRVAQGIDQLLREQPDFDSDHDAVGAHLAAEVVSRRSARMNQNYAAGSARMAERNARVAAALEETERRVEAADADREDLRGKLATAHQETIASNKRADDVQVLEGRKTIAVLLGVAWVALAGALFYLSIPIGGVVALLGLGLFARGALDWTSRLDTSWKAMLLGVAIEVVSIVLSLVLEASSRPPVP